ncbi:methyltransferase domain-containing protein [Rhodopila sp.]|uniref:methyltransferase domain-containing protein n=1 Tax=Rhodopila sp. TaxID=2480087 RepID=UPI002B7D6C30|nr:methyltransferase domain-containing protein [Rhodopila sp.]HVZ08736.1 methyltransferase domain-containing protein [Rhodopila sp.]
MDTVCVSPEAVTLCRRVASLIEAGRTGAARPLLAAARALAPDGSPELAVLSARLALRDGDAEAALRGLDDAIAQAPGHAPLHKARAEAHLSRRDAEAAARDAAEAVTLDRSDTEAKALLGNALLALGRTAEAAACLGEAVEDAVGEAVAAAPRTLAWREALATALEAGGQPEAALDVLARGVSLAPSHIGLRNAAMLICIRQRDFHAAIHLAEEARAIGIADACTFGMQGHALTSLGAHDAAALAYEEALKLGPHDPYVRHLAAASGCMSGTWRAPAEYVTTVFDGYADRFESHLITLGYSVPARIRDAVARHPAMQAGCPLGPALGPALDLGCGTGLMGLVLSDLPVGPITGVDLSPRMLAQARAKGLYADLREADILAVLQEEGQWRLITAADVLVYFGALEDVFTAVQARLAPGGWFAFSLEARPPGEAGWALHRLGRYAHAEAYVRHALTEAGLCLLRCDALPMRREADTLVPGLLVVAERPGA